MKSDNHAAQKPALVHDWLTGMRGGEKVLLELARMYPEAPIYSLFHLPGSLSEELESREIETTWLNHLPALGRYYRYALPLFPRAIESLDLSEHDLVISTSHCVAKAVPTSPGAVHVSYCHTPVRYAWDQEAAYFGTSHTPWARARAAFFERLRLWDTATSVRADRFVANSSFVAERIRRYWGRDARVVAPPVDTEFFTPGPDDEPPRRDYCLSVAALAPYKLVGDGIEACARLGMRILVVGDGPERQKLEGRAGSHVEWLGRVDDETLRTLYRGALCLLQPGVEDFGISSVEALACGTPVVARGAGGILDIVEDREHGVLFDGDASDGPAATAAAIETCRRLQFNSLDLCRRAERFSQQNFRRSMAQCIEEATTAVRRQQG